MVRDMFNERDQEYILKIQLNDSSAEDVDLWSLEHSGIYSVKSAYKFIQLQKGIWCTLDNDIIWHCLWRTKL